MEEGRGAWDGDEGLGTLLAAAAAAAAYDSELTAGSMHDKLGFSHSQGKWPSLLQLNVRWRRTLME